MSRPSFSGIDPRLFAPVLAERRFTSSKRRTRGLSLAQIGGLRAASAVSRRLSIKARVATGERLGALVRNFQPDRYRRTRERIEQSLGVERREAARIARACYRSLGRTLFECLALDQYARPSAAELIEVGGLEHLRRAVAEGRGVLLFSAHYGNWELAAFHQARLGMPMALLVKPSTNGLIERELTTWRESSGNLVIPRESALLRLKSLLRRGGIASLLIDQHVATPPKVIVPFFGRAVSCTPALGYFALRLGSPVIPFASLPLEGGRHRVEYYPPLEVPRAGDLGECAVEMTARANQVIEQWIRRRPEPWLWLHDRWKLASAPPEPGSAWVRG